MSHTNAYSGRRTPEGEEQSQHSEQQFIPPPTAAQLVWRETVSEQQEWTPERLISYLDTKAKDGSFKERMQIIADDINVALAAERQRREQAEKWLDEKRDESAMFAADASKYHSQLLSAQAAIEKHNFESRSRSCYVIDIDPSAIRQHDADKQAEIDEAREQRDWLIKECGRVGVTVNVKIGAPITEAYRLVNNDAEVRKPLVDALNRVKEWHSENGEPRRIIDNALAKEGKIHIEPDSRWERVRVLLQRLKEHYPSIKGLEEIEDLLK